MRIKPRSRPHYSPFERLAILELQAARGWNKAQTAKTFMIDQDTIYSWTKRTDEQGKHAFIEIPEPINKFPQFVTYIVQRLKVLCPTTAKRQKKDPLTFLQALLARGAGCTRDILFAGFTPP